MTHPYSEDQLASKPAIGLLADPSGSAAVVMDMSKNRQEIDMFLERVDGAYMSGLSVDGTDMSKHGSKMDISLQRFEVGLKPRKSRFHGGGNR